MANVKVNLVNLKKTVSIQADRAVLPKVAAKMEQRFTEEKNVFLSEFYQHPVTKELDAGPYAKSAEYGNLFSFLGFEQGESPASDLGSFLQNNITKGRVVRERSSNRILFKLTTRIPTLEEIKNRTSTLVWINRSWVDIIEKGALNFKKYFFDATGRFRNSRSGTGVQTDSEVRNRTDFRPRPYIRELLATFKERLKRPIR